VNIFKKARTTSRPASADRAFRGAVKELDDNRSRDELARRRAVKRQGQSK